MPLKLNLKPGERLVINGAVIRNPDRRHVLMVETQSDVIRGKDLLEPDAAATPVSKVYYLIQTALTQAETRDKLVPVIQRDLATLATVFGGAEVAHIFEAANYVSQSDFYKALTELRPVLRHEEVLIQRSSQRPPTNAGVPTEARP
ncbi:MAG: flagellar biosynthesis repressor FlbT [Pseudomonadota bacterium]